MGVGSHLGVGQDGKTLENGKTQCRPFPLDSNCRLTSSKSTSAPRQELPSLLPPPLPTRINTQYAFGYSVSDAETGDSKSREEKREGSVVSGSYTVADPDGRLRTVTYTDDGSGFVAHVTYDGAIGPPAIPFSDGAINGPGSTIPSQDDQLDSPPQPLQPLAEPQVPEDLDVIVAKGQEEEDEGDVGDKNPLAQNWFPHLRQQAHQLHTEHQQAHHVHQQAHQLHLDHNQLHALHLLQPQVPVLNPSRPPASLSATTSLFDTEPAAILARANNSDVSETPSFSSLARSKQPTRVVVVRRRPVQPQANLLQRQPFGSPLIAQQSNNLDLSQFTLLGVGRVLG